jgi:hypothetical protein
LSTASGKHVVAEEFENHLVSHQELQETLDGYHKWRWRAIGTWALAFSILVTAALYSYKYQADQRKKDRDVQLAAIVTAGHSECLRAFSAMTTILHASIPPSRIDGATASERKVINRLFALADPVKNCPPGNLSAKEKKILQQTTTKGT